MPFLHAGFREMADAGRRRRLAMGSVAAVLLGTLLPGAEASGPGSSYTAAAYPAMGSYHGPYFGKNNFPPGCTREASSDDPANICFRMKDLSRLNPLGTAEIEVLLLVPLSGTAERDMRIMRQAVAMWDGGIHYLAPKMGLSWLGNLRFHVTLDFVDPSQGIQIPALPVPPDIVVVGFNPSAGTGAGLDPLQLAGVGGVPCPPIAAPFDMNYWHSLPGFDSHHVWSAGTFSETCGSQDAQGNHHVCFVVNGAQDPDPTKVDWFGSFWLTSHEFGHCLTLGHVGDGAEGRVNNVWWGPLPYDEIMNYEDHGDIRLAAGGQPVFDRCASTLDVETLALRMSHFLDVNGDGTVGPDDVRIANDQVGVSGDGFPMQVQNPSDYYFASSTGIAKDCPQPDLGLLPGDPSFETAAHWEPTPVDSAESVLDVTSPAPGTTTSSPTVAVSGTVSERSLFDPPPPSSTSVTYLDNSSDATTPYTEIKSVTATATDTNLDAVINLGQVWPYAQGSQFSYSVVVNGMRFDSFVLDPKKTQPEPLLTDGWEYVGSTEWDVPGSRVLIHIPRAWLRRFAITAPYQIQAIANNAGTVATAAHDDWAPDQGTVSIAAPPERYLTQPPPAGGPNADDDGDSVANSSDRCPQDPAVSADGCTAQTPSQVTVAVDGRPAGTQTVYTDYGPASFSVPVTLDGSRQHIVTVQWVRNGSVLASDEFAIHLDD